MGRIFNALRYGNAKTRRYIISIFFLLLIGVISAIKAIQSLAPLWAMVAIFSFLMVFLFINSLSFQESKDVKKSKKINHRNEKKSNYILEEKKESDVAAKENENENYIEKYNEASIKKVFYYYKVKKNHIPILIDSWKSEDLKQCPAYVWLNKSYFHLLAIGKDVKKVEIPRKNLIKILYEKGVTANINEDYQAFKNPSFISIAFSGLLPTVYEFGCGIKTAHKKNLYVLFSDLKITNTSVKALIDLLQVDFSIPEEEIYSKRYSPYFTLAYKLNILLKDGVLSVNDYKIKIKEVLLSLAVAEISFDAFKIYINQLIQGRLITKEYAEYYVDYRKKNKKERESVIE